MRFLKGTKTWHLRLGGGESCLNTFTDADWGGDRDDRRSIGAYIVKVGSGAVSWKSKKQTCIALSSTEAEYVTLCQVAKECEWLLEFLGGLGFVGQHGLIAHVDNTGAISLAKNLVFHNRSKHIDIQYHFTRRLVRKGRLGLAYLPTKEMLADLLTKPLPRAQHEYLARGIGLF